MTPTEVSRRRALIGGAALAAGGALDAFVLEPNWLDITSHEVSVAGLPRTLDGFTIAQVTDAHQPAFFATGTNERFRSSMLVEPQGAA